MSQQAIVRPPDQYVDIDRLKDELAQLAYEFKYQRQQIENTVARIGYIMCEVNSKKLWIDLGFHSYGAFIDDFGAKLGLQRTQLYEYKGVVEKLSPYVSEDEMGEIGITRARELKRYLALTGKVPSNELIAYAKKKSVAEVKARVYLEVHGEEVPNQKWFELGGFYATDDEAQEIKDVFALAASVDPPVSSELSESARRKEIVMRLIQEFRATYEGYNE